MSNYIGAIDSGTTSTRFILFDKTGAIVAYDQREHEQIFPQSGWVEHNPEEIWERTRQVIGATLAKTGATATDIAAIGITNQRETTLVWDKLTGKPVYNAIVWQDTRTDRICKELTAAGHAEQIYYKTGLPIATYFAGPKIRWILENVPGARARAEAGELLFGTVDTWLIWQLTGGHHVTDPTNASRTMLMNLETLDWDDELLSILGVPRSLLPEIRPSSDPRFYGKTTTSGPFRGEVPVCGDLGDQQAATVGQTCFSPGEAKNTYGTGCFVLMNAGETPCRSAHGLITTLAWKIGEAPAVYALEGSIAIAGAAVQWLRDNIGLIRDSAEIEALARSVPDNGDVYFVPAFAGLFAPYWRADARGLIAGLTRFSNKGHIARATLEAVAYQTHDALAAMASDSGIRIGALKVDGGMAANDLLMQFQADILDAPVIRPRNIEATARGAFLAAALATGRIGAIDDLRPVDEDSARFTPDMPAATRARLLQSWRKAVDRASGWRD